MTGNTATGFGGGIYTDRGFLTLQAGSSVTGNTSDRGGGIYSFFGELALQTGSSVTGNTAPLGGGIYRSGGGVTLEGANPSLIVVNNCQDNCAGNAVAKCAAMPVSCP